MLTEDEEIVDVLRSHRRTLRTVNKKIRKQVQELQDNADTLFAEICNTNNEAVLAMEKLAKFGGFEVGPANYNHVVESYTTAMKQAYDMITACVENRHRPHRPLL
jgi:hypothetical protein